MSSSSLTFSKISNYYHSGHFQDAEKEITQALQNIDCTQQQQRNHGNHDDIFSALPKLALKADQALCLFRSLRSSTNIKEQSDRNVIIQGALDAARKHNEEYMMALKDIVYHSISLDNRNTTATTINDGDIVETAMAIIMTSISGSWLYLHSNKQSIIMEEQSNVPASTARVLLQDGICLAAACCLGLTPEHSKMPLLLSFDCRGNPHMTWKEGLYILDGMLSSEHKCRVMEEHAIKEQWSIGLRQLHLSLTVVGLALDGAFQCPQDDDDDDDDDNDDEKEEMYHDRQPKKKKIKRCRYDTKMNEPSSSLNIQEYLVEALYHHRQGMHTHASRKKRNEYIQKAMDIEKGGIVCKIKTLFEATDFLLNNTNGELDHQAMQERLDVFMGPLSALSNTCQSVSCLLGCVYAKKRDYDKAMECFQRAWELKLVKDNRDYDNDDGGDIILNIAECFGQKGRIDLFLETLLYWIHTTTTKNANCHADHSVKPAAFRINHKVTNDQDSSKRRSSVLYRIFFAASKVEDWATCRVALDDLMQISVDNDFLPMAKLYTMIRQNVLPPLSDVHMEESLQECHNPLLAIGQRLYESEIIVHHFLYPPNQEQRQNATTMDQKIITQDLLLSALKKIENAQSLWKNLNINLPESNKRQIQSMIDNNLGIALLYNGRPLDAMPLFLSALQASQEEEYHLFPLYNLSLLLWIQEFKKEACKLYLTKRGYKDSLDKALQGQTRYLDLDLEKRLMDLEYAKTNENDKAANGSKMFLLLDICMMEYILKRKL